MTFLLIIITAVSALILLPKFTFFLKLIIEVAILAFYAIALAIIAVITIRSYSEASEDKKRVEQERKKISC